MHVSKNPNKIVWAFVLCIVAHTAMAAPSNLYPANGATNISVNPTLEIGCDETALSGQFQIAASASFAPVAYDSGEVVASICSHVAQSALARGQTYFWRARSKNAAGTLSAWSPATSFTTADPLSRIGILELRDGVKGYGGTRDADIRGSAVDPSVAIREWNQARQTVLRTGRRKPGSETDEIYRSLLSFDLSTLPTDTLVVNAALELTGEGKHSDSGVFNGPRRAYRLLTPWGEWNGGDDECCEFPDIGEVSWSYQAYPDLWHVPGAAGIGSDRGPEILFVTNYTNKPGHATLSSGQRFIETVQQWINSPEDNFGLLLQSPNESIQRVMNLKSREDALRSDRPALRLELVVSEVADLSLDIDVEPATPTQGEPFQIAVTATNAGPDDATGAIVTLDIPASFTINSAVPGAGSFDAFNRRWSIPSLADGATTTLILSGVSSATQIDAGAALIQADQLDPDSYPDNGRAEDDIAELSFAVNPEGQILAGGFNNGDAGGFGYSDDAFRGTAQPNYSLGVLTSTGGFTGGTIRVEIGGVNKTPVSGMSGGWSKTFSVAAATTARISLRYRLWLSRAYEAGECGEALVSLDGVLLGAGANPALAAFCGFSPNQTKDQDTGWQEASFDVALSAGNHVLTVGGYNNLKTGSDEITKLYFDDIQITSLANPDPALIFTPGVWNVALVQGATANQAVSLSTNNGGSANFQLVDDAAWLTTVPGSGNTDSESNVTLSVDTNGLSPGTYGAIVTASAGGYTPATVAVSLNVQQYVPPRLIFAPIAAEFQVSTNQSATKQAVLSTDGTPATAYTITDDAPWLDVSPASGQTNATLTLTVITTGLAEGSYTATVTAQAPRHEPVQLPVSLVVSNAIFSATFATNANPFTYADDRFRGTSQPSFASGAYAAGLGFVDGALRVNLGGVNNTVVTNGMSGGWSAALHLDSQEIVKLTMRYRLVFSGAYEADECGQVLLAVDGALLSTGASDYILQYCGSSPQSNVEQDSGWRQVTIDVLLAAGDHTLAVGAFNSGKTAAGESMYVLLDDVFASIDPDSTPRLSFAMNTIELGVLEGGSASQLVALTMNDASSAAFTLSSNAPWLQATSVSSVTPANVTVAVDAAGLATGTYTGVVTASAIGDDPATVNVTLTVGNTVLVADFNAGPDGFSYADDAFRNTQAPNYANGRTVAGHTGNGLEVQVGGVDSVDILTGMSGGWSRTFQLANAQSVLITLRHRLQDPGTYEDGECSEVMLAVDGLPLGNGANDYLARLCGATPQTDVPQDTGWQQSSVSTVLSAGVHTLTIGGFNNIKTSANERATVTLDDVRIEIMP